MTMHAKNPDTEIQQSALSYSNNITFWNNGRATLDNHKKNKDVSFMLEKDKKFVYKLDKLGGDEVLHIETNFRMK